MIDFATLQGLTIPEGVVTKIESGGVVLWELKTGGAPVILEVEKITSDTYAGETTYTGESFILLDIYPKTNGTVSVTYGGLTKTIADTTGAEKPNAQQVYFGTFNGVSDSVDTPASGELIVEGDYNCVGTGSFNIDIKSTRYYNGITAIWEWGTITDIPAGAFYFCDKLSISVIPEGIVRIGGSAFFMEFEKTAISDITLPSTLKSLCVSSFLTEHVAVSGDYLVYPKSMRLLSVTPPELIVDHEVTSMCNIIVPKGCGEAYKAAEGWSKYADYIVEAS